MCFRQCAMTGDKTAHEANCSYFLWFDRGGPPPSEDQGTDFFASFGQADSAPAGGSTSANGDDGDGWNDDFGQKSTTRSRSGGGARVKSKSSAKPKGEMKDDAGWDADW